MVRLVDFAVHVLNAIPEKIKTVIDAVMFSVGTLSVLQILNGAALVVSMAYGTLRTYQLWLQLEDWKQNKNVKRRATRPNHAACERCGVDISAQRGDGRMSDHNA